jgi:hypothetical protein
VVAARRPDLLLSSTGLYGSHASGSLPSADSRCPVHEDCIVGEAWEAGGLLRKRRFFKCGQPAWLLWHRCPLVHRDLNSKQHAESYFTAVWVDFSGKLFKGSGSDLTLGGEVISFTNSYLIDLRGSGAELLASEARVAGVAFDQFLTALADELNTIVHGSGERVAGQRCR